MGFARGGGYGLQFQRPLRNNSFFGRYGTPANAWALWDVDNAGSNYLEVLRTSDDTTQNFTMAQIAAEEDVTWVNAGGLDFTDDFAGGSTTGLSSSNASLSAPASIGGETDALSVTLTGGSAIHDIRFPSVESAQIYDISFEYYIPSSNAEVNGIRILDTVPDQQPNTLDAWTAVSLSDIEVDNTIIRFAANSAGGISIDADGDVFYLRNLIATQKTSNGLVKSFYDVAESVTATQSNAAEMPEIVQQGVGVSENGKRAIEGDGTQYLKFTAQELTGGFSVFIIASGSNTVTGASSGGADIVLIDTVIRMEINNTNYQVVQDKRNVQTLFSFNRDDSDNLQVRYNGTEIAPSPFASASGGFSYSSILAYNQGTVVFTGKVQGFLFYNEDKSAELADMESEIITEFNIS